jgi:hypothetical protein
MNQCHLAAVTTCYFPWEFSLAPFQLCCSRHCNSCDQRYDGTRQAHLSFHAASSSVGCQRLGGCSAPSFTCWRFVSSGKVVTLQCPQWAVGRVLCNVTCSVTRLSVALQPSCELRECYCMNTRARFEPGTSSGTLLSDFRTFSSDCDRTIARPYILRAK